MSKDLLSIHADWIFYIIVRPMSRMMLAWANEKKDEKSIALRGEGGDVLTRGVHVEYCFLMSETYGGFEKYSKPIYRFIDKISITNKGRVGFNKSICAKQNLKQYDHAVLYWNRAENELGIEFITGPAGPHEPKLIFDKRGYGAHLNALNFFMTYNIDLSKVSGQYEYRKVEVKRFDIEHDGYMFILKLR